MSNKFKYGLYVGKFVAYHKGHQMCINHFSSLCDKLKVVLCSKPTDKIPFEIRKKWIENDIINNIDKDIKYKNIEFYHLVEDNIPLYPEGLYEWCNEIKKLVGNIDIMFGNEEYVIDCAKIFKSDYYIPDMKREEINISSTKIIDSGLSYYSYLSKVAQPYFNKVVSIVGSSNSGKSEISRKLSKKINGYYLEEFGRSFFENEILKCGINGLNNWTIAEFENIASSHDNLLKEIIDKPNKIIFIDINSLLIENYCLIYLREHSKLLKQLIKSQRNIIHENILINNSNISESNPKKEYFTQSNIKNIPLVDNKLMNLFLIDSLQRNLYSFKEFGMSDNTSISKIEDEIYEYLNIKYKI